ncbi:hypothetical protein RHMOL_Rhmol08G0008900 [Rhododendron molle]|uniref:Uncharacterized protein n=1 Tax=Rhododendron molle TaxID=49168 RepID=A0ACC0MIM3_RHOML|nr:hypothetical protein RHMOL_Rhmol08G0008900 [Rhododendron molle]
MNHECTKPQTSVYAITKPSPSLLLQSPIAVVLKNPVMGEPKLPPQPPNHPSSLVQPSNKKKQKPIKVFRALRSVLRSFPIINTPACKFSSLPGGVLPEGHRSSGSSNRVTGTLFGYRKGRVSLSIQENPRTLPTMVVELAMQMNVLQKEMSLGLVMELLKAISMGAGVLPGKSDMNGPDGELAYIRAHFERMVGSKDSETFYMLSPDGNNGPELSIFFVRV